VEEAGLFKWEWVFKSDIRFEFRNFRIGPVSTHFGSTLTLALRSNLVEEMESA
jgi:hypothetical protein